MAQKNIEETIAAIATPLGESGIGVIRISGPASLHILKKIFKRSNRKSYQKVLSHKAKHGWLVNPKTGQEIDEVVAVFFRAPRSFTGEDSVEISLHGSPVILREALQIIIRNGAQIAGPGEFTKRALINGKIDLIQAEAIMDLIQAKTENTAQIAASQLKGKLSKEIKAIRANIIDFLKTLEAELDFPDDIKETSNKAKIGAINRILKQTNEMLKGAEKGRVIRQGVRIAIIGKPNVGKSSILNAILKQERAITSATPGTTRDTIEENVNIKGLGVVLVDTAGISGSSHEVEVAGIGRSMDEIMRSELALMVVDGSRPIENQDREIYEKIDGKNAIIVLNKADLKQIARVGQIGRTKGRLIAKTTAINGAGVKQLENMIIRSILKGKIVASNHELMTNIRHIECLGRAQEALIKGKEAFGRGMASEAAAGEIKLAAKCIGELTGEDIKETVIEQIFSSFCVGK